MDGMLLRRPSKPARYRACPVLLAAHCRVRRGLPRCRELGSVGVMADEPTLSRRAIIRGMGTASVLAGCRPCDTSKTPNSPVAGTDAPELSGSLEEVGPGPVALTFVLNGRALETRAEASASLLDVLRLDLAATGTKLVCDRGACGACIVHVDGVPKNSCMVLAHDIAGAQITTVEGLARNGRPSPLQEAFVAHDAQQCGFCTSGMLMSASALLKRHRGRALAASDVRDALCGNLCRCGTHPHVVAAVLDAAGKQSSDG